MNTTSTFPVGISISLEELRQIIEDKETTGGPLIAVSPYKRENTWITYANDTPPGKTIQVQEINVGSTPPTVGNHQLICIGDCFINGKTQCVAIYRSN